MLMKINKCQLNEDSSKSSNKGARKLTSYRKNKKLSHYHRPYGFICAIYS